MTPIAMTAAAAVIAAATGAGPVDQDRITAPGVDTGDARIIRVKTGYFRRDLGNDPRYNNYVHDDKRNSEKNKGFRSGGPRTYPESGIFIYYDGGHHYIGWRGLRLKHADPDLLEK
ncbi:MAG: hypothetical protein ACR2PM_11980 [Hyphomicrobiales bacterium]